MTGQLRAIGWNVLVIEDKPAEKTNSGLALPQMSRLPPCTGRIFSIGEAAKKEHPELAPAKRVYFRPFNGRELVWQGIRYRLLGRQEALALVESSA
jgi:co-chaperonin GroES (HSP10)